MEKELKDRLNNLLMKDDFHFIKIVNTGCWTDSIIESENFYIGIQTYSIRDLKPSPDKILVKLKRKDKSYLEVSSYINPECVSEALRKANYNFLASAINQPYSEEAKYEKEIEDCLDSIGA